MVRSFQMALVAWTLGLTFVISGESPAFKKTGEVALPGVEGRIDHLAFDLKGRRLFVAALGNDSLEVVDLDAKKAAQSLKDQKEPQGVLYLADQGLVVVSNGEGNSVDIRDGTSLKKQHTIEHLSDADNMRYDAAAQRVYAGFGNGALAVIDPAKGEKTAEIKLDGHPEAFALEKKGSRIFVNVPTKNQVAVVDREKQTVIKTWSLKEAHSNFPMDLDEERHRLFVGCRRPAKLLVLDTDSGKTVAALDGGGDADDVFYDATSKRIYVSSGEGEITVFDQTDADHYNRSAKIPTASGARTALWVPEDQTLYLAVPHRGEQPAAIWTYKTVEETKP